MSRQLEIYDCLLHDLRSVLTVVVAGATTAGQVASKGSGSTGPEAVHLNRTILAASHAIDLCRRYTGLAKSRPKQTGTVHVKALVSDLRELMTYHPIFSGRTLLVSDVPEDWIAEVHPSEALQILWNFAINAAEASPLDRPITLQAGFVQDFAADFATEPATSEGRVWLAGHHFDQRRAGFALSVADQGNGIPHERLARVFDAYSCDKPGGFGLGLAIVRHLLDDSMAAAEISSTEGQGTRATLIVPSCTRPGSLFTQPSTPPTKTIQ